MSILRRLSLLRQPQLFLSPILRSCEEARVSCPQEHLHFHMTSEFLFSALSRTVSFSNTLPVRSSALRPTRFFLCSSLTQPQLVVEPVLRCQLSTLIILPQSHRHSHVRYLESPSTFLRTVRFPYFFPVRSSFFGIVPPKSRNNCRQKACL